MTGFYWIDSTRNAYVARVYGITGPRGGRVVLWEARADGRTVATTTRMCDARTALEHYLNPPPAPIVEMVNARVDEMRRQYRTAPDMVAPHDAESSMTRDGFAALDTGNNFSLSETGRVMVRLGACFYPLFTTRHNAPVAAVQQTLRRFWH